MNRVDVVELVVDLVDLHLDNDLVNTFLSETKMDSKNGSDAADDPYRSLEISSGFPVIP